MAEAPSLAPIPPEPTRYDLHDSPFLELRNPLTAFDVCRIIFLFPIAIVRSFIGCMALCVIAAINTFAAYNHPIDQPLAPWRRNLILASKELVVVVFWMLGFLNIQVHGHENIARAIQLKGVVIFNHVAWLDAFALVWLMAPSGVAKAFNAHLPVIKHAVRALQTVYLPDAPRRTRPPPVKASAVAAAAAPVAPLLSADFVGGGGSSGDGSGGGQGTHERTGTPSEGLSDSRQPQGQQEAAGDGVAAEAPAVAAAAPPPPPGMTEVLLQRVNDPRYCERGGFPVVVMAPEAVCSSGRGLLQFRTGAFVLGRPVLPVLLKYSNTVFNPAWTLQNDLFHYLRLITQWSNALEITILPPYTPSPEELASPRLFADNVRLVMAEGLGVPCVEQSGDHFYALYKAGIRASFGGSKAVGPPGVVSEEGFADLGPHMRDS
ncbi:MAG: hypothetical protein WDW38_005160 [Sanguina aurantia]